MIVLKLKNLFKKKTNKKSVVFFSICSSMCSEFITEEAPSITLDKISCSAVIFKKLEKNLRRSSFFS